MKHHKYHLEHGLTEGQKAADRIAQVVGSWRFLIIQSIILFFWLVLNVAAWMQHWDPYPFILLNLTLSFQAAYATPIILMSQNRETERDRAKEEADYVVNRKAEKEIEEMHKHLHIIEGEKIDKIITMLENNKTS